MSQQSEIQKLEEEIAHLKEYLLSDCCRQCSQIIEKIENYNKEIDNLRKVSNSEF